MPHQSKSIVIFGLLFLVVLVVGEMKFETCLRKATAGKLKKPTPRVGRQLFLYFGDAAIEAVQVLGVPDFQQIMALGKCVYKEESTLFDVR
jgi:hypothetical protein